VLEVYLVLGSWSLVLFRNLFLRASHCRCEPLVCARGSANRPTQPLDDPAFRRAVAGDCAGADLRAGLVVEALSEGGVEFGSGDAGVLSGRPEGVGFGTARGP